MIELHSPAELPRIAASVGLELRSQYVLAYRPSNPARDGKWRPIRVALAPSAGGQRLHVHARKGYLAPEE